MMFIGIARNSLHALVCVRVLLSQMLKHADSDKEVKEIVGMVSKLLLRRA